MMFKLLVLIKPILLIATYNAFELTAQDTIKKVGFEIFRERIYKVNDHEI